MQSAVSLFNRLTEGEKIELRRASQDRIKYLADATFLVDLINVPALDREAIVIEAKALCDLQFSEHGAKTTF
jgi:hypothetical protein